MYRSNSKNIGEFTEQDYGHCFTYRATEDTWALKHGLTHEVDVGYDTRFAKVTKSRCYMALDEASDGSPVLETWKIRKHVEYVK